MTSEVQSPTATVCTRCGAPISLEDATRDYGALCQSCGAVTWIALFTAAFDPPRPVTAEPVIDPDEASCFYHPTRRAAVLCQICGRFLCALCEIDIGDRKLCPVCLETGRLNRSIQALETRRVRFDNIALGIAVIPALFVWPAIFSAPTALFLAIRYWRAPGSIVGRSRLRLGLAIALALLQLGAIVTLVVILIKSRL